MPRLGERGKRPVLGKKGAQGKESTEQYHDSGLYLVFVVFVECRLMAPGQVLGIAMSIGMENTGPCRLL